MRPIRLYIENFMCYEKAFIDFREFSSALIVGKKDNNDHHSNGVGKSTIFNSIEYVLFNQSEFSLEKVVRDDTNACKVVFDFIIGDQEYRISRTRTKKGSTDLTLLQRNSVDGLETQAYHSDTNDPYTDKKTIEKFWKDISGSRAGDTEKDLSKLIKFNYKSFASTVLFPLYDTAGLPTTTPEKRKGILKEAFNLLIYAKLEKITKDRLNFLTKELENNKIVIDNLGDPVSEIKQLHNQLVVTNKSLKEKTIDLEKLNEELLKYTDKVSSLTTDHSNLESKFSNLLNKEKSLITDRSRLEISIKEYQSKRANVSRSAKEIVEEISLLKDQQTKLAGKDYPQIDILTEERTALSEQLTICNLNIKNSIEAIDKLRFPLPSGSVCEKCHKPMSNKDREDHKVHVSRDLENYQKSLQQDKSSIVNLNKQILSLNQIINDLMREKQQLESINTKITSKNKEVQDKRTLHEEYSALLSKFMLELTEKNKEFELVQVDLQNSSIDEAKAIKLQIESEKQKITTVMSQVGILNKEITHYNSNKAVIQHTIDQNEKSKIQKEKLEKTQLELKSKIVMLPTVAQSFSTTGIPNLIIQNVLDDLQVEANNLLTQLKPGLQLSFAVEKTKGDGDQADTLDINYMINGKERSYKQLGSKGMQLAVAFSLKLGLSFLLQKMMGAEIKFLLIDEIDQSLDKASVDAFADIVKFFQKDFTILIITHNDRMKDKFSHAILVEQDINMISKAKVVSSW